MKTPSNPQFSPFGPIKCREKTLITTKFFWLPFLILGGQGHHGQVRGRLCGRAQHEQHGREQVSGGKLGGQQRGQ